MPERAVYCWHMWQFDCDWNWLRQFKYAQLGKLHPKARKKLAEMRAMSNKRLVFTKSRGYWHFFVWGGPGLAVLASRSDLMAGHSAH
eukprot:12488512-Alexandrium_andersonii.AAC.1